jgi:hypothetical protein
MVCETHLVTPWYKYAVHLLLLFPVSSQTAARINNPRSELSDSLYIVHRARDRVLTDTWPNSVNALDKTSLCPDCALRHSMKQQ